MALTKKDIKQIDSMMDNKFETQKGDIVDAVRDEITKFKSDMFTKIDPILKEIEASRAEQNSKKIRRNTKRISELEVRVAA